MDTRRIDFRRWDDYCWVESNIKNVEMECFKCHIKFSDYDSAYYNDNPEDLLCRNCFSKCPNFRYDYCYVRYK